MKGLRSFLGSVVRNTKSYFLGVSKFFSNSVKKPSISPIIIIGHQKSGTTAIAQLLGKGIGKSVSIDPFYRTPNKQTQLPSVYSNKKMLGVYIAKNGYLFSEGIIKDPEFSFFYPELKILYPHSKFVFIIRNPFDNIKSIFDRLKIPGDIKEFDENFFPEVTKTWDWHTILNGELTHIKGKNIVETLALRWVYSTHVYLDNQQHFVLVKYEDFRKNKIESISNLSINLGEIVRNDISDVMNKQFQPKGKSAFVEAKDFFSKENFETIGRICGDLNRTIYEGELL